LQDYSPQGCGTRNLLDESAPQAAAGLMAKPPRAAGELDMFEIMLNQDNLQELLCRV
jgi:hypothetical protein